MKKAIIVPLIFLLMISVVSARNYYLPYSPECKALDGKLMVDTCDTGLMNAGIYVDESTMKIRPATIDRETGETIVTRLNWVCCIPDDQEPIVNLIEPSDTLYGDTIAVDVSVNRPVVSCDYTLYDSGMLEQDTGSLTKVGSLLWSGFADATGENGVDYTVTVSCTDYNTNEGTDSSGLFEVDTVVDETQLFDPISNEQYGGLILISAVANDTQNISIVYFEYFNGSEWILIGSVPGSGPTANLYGLVWDTADSIVSPVDGFVDVRIRAVDTVGNERVDVATNVEIDNNPPIAIDDLGATTSTSPKTVDLSWTAPADAGDGTEWVSAYEFKYSDNPITDETDYQNANSIAGGTCVSSTPAAPGTGQACSVNSLPLDNQLYYFATKSQDNTGKWSAMSIVASAETLFVDVEVDSIEVSKNGETSLFTIYLYDSIDVKSEVTNYGNVVETVNITLFDGSQLIAWQVIILNPNETKWVNFTWVPNSAGLNKLIKVNSITLDHSDMGVGPNQQQSLEDIYSVVSELSFDFNDLLDYPKPKSEGTIDSQPFMVAGTIAPNNQNFIDLPLTIDFSSSFIIDGYYENFGRPMSCTGGNCVVTLDGLGLDTIPIWDISDLSPGDHTVTLTIGNLGDQLSVNRVIEIPGSLTVIEEPIDKGTKPIPIRDYVTVKSVPFG